MDLWIDEFYGLTKTYEDIFKKKSKKQKPTDENPDPYWSPHLTKRKSKPKRYSTKGQLISKGNFSFFNSPKKRTSKC